MKGASSAIKYLKVWQKNAEERRHLVDQENTYPSYIQPPTSPQPNRSRSPTSSISLPNDGRKISSSVTPKFGRKSSANSYEGHKSFNPQGNVRKISTVTSKERSVSTSSAGRGSHGNENFTCDEVFDDTGAKSRTEFENPAYKWLYDTPVVSIRSDNHPTSNLQSIAELSKMEFNKLPFASYKSSVDKWNEAIMQGSAVSLALILIPFVIMMVIFIVIKTRFRPKLTRSEKRKETLGLLVLLIVILIKDLILTVIIVSLVLNIPLSTVRIGYPLFLFFWILVFCCAPVATFYYADPSYEFGINRMKKICVQLASHFTFSSLKATALGKVDIQGVYFNKNYPIMSSISGSNDEHVYLKTVVSKLLLFTGIFTAIVLCIIRTVPFLYETVLPPWTYYNNTLNNSLLTDIEKDYVHVFLSLRIISDINSLFTSLFFSAWILYVMFWNIAMFKEWQLFNTNERDDEKTLINKGPQAIALWWKIRQTFILYTQSSVSMSSLLGKIVFVTCLCECASVSVVLVVVIARNTENMDWFGVVSLLVDNFMIYLIIATLYTLFYMIHRERSLSSKLLQLKKLNVGYEVSCLANLEQEIVDRDPNLRNRLRILRGRLLLLDEMMTAVNHVDYDDRITPYTISMFVVSLCVLISSIYAIAFFLLEF